MLNIILEEIKKHQTIIIHRHIRPDGDCIGSQVGLKEIIKETFPMKRVYVVGEEYEKLKYIGIMDDVSDEAYKEALVIIVDVANLSRISDQRFIMGKTKIKIDHHPKREVICDIEWIDTSYASCCEMIVDLYIQLKGELKMNEKAAQALYYGIVTDTARFIAPTVNRRTFFLASILLDYPIDIHDIYRSIYREPMNIVRLKGYVLSHFTCTKNGLGYIKLDKKICDEYQIDANIVSTLTSILSNITDVKVYFIAIYDEVTHRVRISLRSQDYVINHIAEKYQGGGHRNASGIMVDTFDEVDQLIIDLEAYLLEIKA